MRENGRGVVVVVVGRAENLSRGGRGKGGRHVGAGAQRQAHKADVHTKSSKQRFMGGRKEEKQGRGVANHWMER